MTYADLAKSCTAEEVEAMLRALDTIKNATGERPGHVSYLNKEEMRACAEQAWPQR